MFLSHINKEHSEKRKIERRKHWEALMNGIWPMDAGVHLTFIIRNGKYPAITWEQVTTQLTEGGVG